MMIDGIKYQLVPHTVGATTESFHVRVEGRDLLGDPRPVVVRRGRSWTIIARNAGRIEADTRPDMFILLAKLVHG